MGPSLPSTSRHLRPSSSAHPSLPTPLPGRRTRSGATRRTRLIDRRKLERPSLHRQPRQLRRFRSSRALCPASPSFRCYARHPPYSPKPRRRGQGERVVTNATACGYWPPPCRGLELVRCGAAEQRHVSVLTPRSTGGLGGNVEHFCGVQRDATHHNAVQPAAAGPPESGSRSASARRPSMRRCITRGSRSTRRRTVTVSTDLPCAGAAQRRLCAPPL